MLNYSFNKTIILLNLIQFVSYRYVFFFSSITQVHFADDPVLETVYTVGTENRCGDWMLYAVERERFVRRIQKCSFLISPILAAKHRTMVYEQRVNA